MDSESQSQREKLVSFYHEVKDCEKCALSATRTRVVFGTGDPDADVMFVGEAPGFHEDREGKPFVGQAGKLLDRLLEEVGMERGQVFIANVLKCRPPNNRDPQMEEIEACEPHLRTQIELIRPRIICTLGNFATKLLSGSRQGITKVHGNPQVHTFGSRTVLLYPIYHPAAALYTPAMLEALRSDLARLPDLIEQPFSDLPDGGAGDLDLPEGGAGYPESPASDIDLEPVAAGSEQLGLF